MMNKRLLLGMLLGMLLTQPLPAQHLIVPDAYGNLWYDNIFQRLIPKRDGPDFRLRRKTADFTLSSVTPQVAGAPDGLRLLFTSIGMRNGTLTYGLIPYGQSSFPTAVLRFEVKIDTNGAAFLPISKHLKDSYDHSGWQKKNFGVIGYRLTDPTGLIVYEGKQAFARTEKGFEPRPTVQRGPFVSEVTDKQAVLWYETSAPVFTSIKTDAAEDTFFSRDRKMHHEVRLTNLQAGSEYWYTVGCDSADLREVLVLVTCRVGELPPVAARWSKVRLSASILRTSGKRRSSSSSMILRKSSSAFSHWCNWKRQSAW